MNLIPGASLRFGSLSDHISIARPDHWFKNVFMLPGALVAFVIDPAADTGRIGLLIVGIISTCLVASANYTINEYLDAEFDAHHPTKHKRPSAQGRLNGPAVLFQYIVLSLAGLAIAAMVGTVFLIASVTLLAMGVIYNVEPVRSKDRVYIDVLSESINNPIRLVLGWAAVTSIVLPPVSLLIAYWMGGAYLMAIKRFSEFRMIDDPAIAARYRKSFRYYTSDKLLVSAFFYALTSVFFLGVFLIKYRTEFVFSFPLFAILFSWYLWLAVGEKSVAATPEKLYENKAFVSYVVLLVGVCLVLLKVDMPGLRYLSTHIVTSDPRISW